MPKRTKRNRRREPTADATLVKGSGPTRGRAVPVPNFISTHLGGVPQHTRNTLIFCQAFAQVVNATTQAQLSAFNLNGPFLPYAAAGGQPVGFAKMMAFYSKCFVTGARIKAHIVSEPNTSVTGTAMPAVIYGLTITTNTTAMTSYFQAIGSGLTTFKVLGQSPDACTLQTSVDIGRYLNKPDVLDDSQLFTSVSSNPSQIVCGHLWWYNNSATAGGNIVYVTIEYDCIFTDPIMFT
jgi:hypothetical protein